MRVLIFLLLSVSTFAQSGLLEVEVTKHQEGPDVVLKAKNHTDSTYIVTVDVQSHGMNLSRPVPFDVRVAGGKEVRLITLTPIPGKPWGYRQSYSFKPVPPPVQEPAREADVSDAVQEVLDILERSDEQTQHNPERDNPVNREVSRDASEEVVDHEIEEEPPPADPEPVIQNESPVREATRPPRPDPPSTGKSSRTTRGSYIPASVSDEFGHATPHPDRDSYTAHNRRNTEAAAYIPDAVLDELRIGGNMPNRPPTRSSQQSGERSYQTKQTTHTPPAPPPVDILGLRTVAYRVPDLQAAKSWYARAFNTQPSFDESFYVGFSIGGYELGLQPIDGSTRTTGENAVTYWGVNDIQASMAHFLAVGATKFEEIQDVGGGIEVAAVKDPWGNVIGLIHNPHFQGK